MRAEAASAVMWSFGFADGSLSWLPGLDEVLGMTGAADHLVRARLLTLIEPLIETAAADPTPRNLELEQRSDSGEWIRLLARTYGADTTEGLLGTAANTTRRHADQQALADLADRYRLLLELSPDAVCVHEGGQLTYVNPATVRFLGADSPADLVGRPFSEVASMGEPPTSGASEIVLTRLDGSSMPVETVSVRTTWEGRPASQVVMRDVTAQKAAEAALRYQAALVGHVSDAIIATDSRGVVTSWNPAAETVYGRPASEAVGRAVADVVGAPLDPAAVLRAGGFLQTAHRRSDGGSLAIRVSAAEMDSGYVLLCADETARRRAESHFSTVVASLDEGVVVVGPKGHIESANPAAQRILGLSEDELIGLLSTRLQLYAENGKRIPPHHYPATDARRAGSPPTRRVIRLRRPDGRNVWLSLTSRLLNPEDTCPTSVVTSFTDITARRAIGERLEHEASHDPLTELANRTLVLSKIGTALRKAKTTTVLFIDLDKFKVINDSLGHGVGDKVLRIAGERLRRGVGPKDLVGRLGGDEFVVVSTALTEPGEVKALAEHLRESLTAPVTISGRQLRIDASIGIVLAQSEDDRCPEDVLRDADVAMYQAKTLGRGRHEFFDVGLRERMQRRLQLDQDLRDALRSGDGQLWPAYQPLIDITTGRMVAVEALSRWTHPVHGQISPVEFIPLAEESDLINVLGTHMLQVTTRELARQRDELGLDIHLKVNISTRQLDDPGLVPAVRDALASTGLPPHTLCLEVTESALMRDPVAATEVLRALRGLGVRLAIDDFGTGYSSLAQLQRLTLDTLKIDRSFVTGLGESADSEAIVTSIIAMAHAVDLTVVAEGVEHLGQLEILRRLGCDQAQGFYLGKPAAAGDLFPLVRPDQTLPLP
jgi:diguanylate cyclase (GGDEF)-like protein/PAS domain S-box-containing protein